MKPYVGVTGVRTLKEVDSVLRLFSENSYSTETSPIPMIGYLVSWKTLSGQPVKNRRYPRFKNLPALVERAHKDTLTMIHYNSREEGLADQVQKIFQGMYAFNWCKALQLNIVWPNPEEVKKIKDLYPEIKIVIQLSHKAMEGLTPDEISQRVKAYGKTLTYALIDPSGGRGIAFDLEHSLNIYCALEDCALTIGFAGGFTGDNVEKRVNTLIEKLGHNNFCIDAEGGLRNKRSQDYGDDDFNTEKVKAYLMNARNALA